MTQNTLPNDQNTIIKIKAIPPTSKLFTDALISGYKKNNQREMYKFDNYDQAILPLQEFIQFRNGVEVAEIDLKPLMQYPQYQHHVHAQTYNTKQPQKRSAQTQIIINFMQLPVSQSPLPIKLVFHDANLTHDTEFLAKMAPYLKVKVNNTDKFTSKVIKGGNKNPNFNQEETTIGIRSIRDQIKIQIWDKDMLNDDLIGERVFKGFQLLNCKDLIITDLFFNEKKGAKKAGTIRFQARNDLIF